MLPADFSAEGFCLGVELLEDGEKSLLPLLFPEFVTEDIDMKISIPRVSERTNAENSSSRPGW